MLAITILRYVDASYPGWVEASFGDAHGRQHMIREKVPVISVEDLSATSDYPRPGVIACEVISRRRAADGREIVRITTERPWGCESITGEREFDVLPEQLSINER